METLRLGSKGSAVKLLQHWLLEHGFNPGRIDGHFGARTHKAVRAFQLANKLADDGIVGRKTHAILAIVNETPTQTENQVNEAINVNNYVSLVIRMCAGSPAENIKENWPLILHSLIAQKLSDGPMVLMAIATVYVETGSFKPISEYISKYNTTFTSHNFDKYDDRADLGNIGAPDGESYKGRGYIQLTGRSNYRNIGRLIGLGDGLEINPELANEPQIAADILAAFLKRQERSIRIALSKGDLAKARRIVNGGRHGLPEFERCYTVGRRLLAQ